MAAVVLAMPKLPAEGITLLSKHFEVRQLPTSAAGLVPVEWASEVVAIATPGRDPGLGERLGARMFDQLPSLAVISSFSSGVDGIDPDAAAERSIPILNAPDALVEPVADIALGLAIDVMRGITAGDRFVRSGGWSTSAKGLGTSLSGRTAGILGLGRIGASLARRLKACGMTILYCNRKERSDVPYAFRPSAAALAADCDLLLACCPATPETRDIIDAKVLRALGPRGYFVNVSRGAVVDEDALIEALRERGIAGAGLDVFKGEPEIDPRFLGLETAILSPHLGAATNEARHAMFEAMTLNLLAFFQRRKTEAAKPTSGTADGIRTERMLAPEAREPY